MNRFGDAVRLAMAKCSDALSQSGLFMMKHPAIDNLQSSITWYSKLTRCWRIGYQWYYRCFRVWWQGSNQRWAFPPVVRRRQTVIPNFQTIELDCCAPPSTTLKSSKTFHQTEIVGFVHAWITRVKSAPHKLTETIISIFLLRWEINFARTFANTTVLLANR